jgi:2'-5' RNA ligase
MVLSGVPEIEAVRMRFNPTQAALIPAHVTLCREDEVADWAELESRLVDISPVELTMEFGSPVRDGNLVYLPAISGIEQFDDLRFRLLSTPNGARPRKQNPHITLIHPRNGHCTDTVFKEISRSLHAFSWTFCEISLIVQWGGEPWVRLV